MNSREPVTNVDILIFERFSTIFTQKLILTSFTGTDVTAVISGPAWDKGTTADELGQRWVQIQSMTKMRYANLGQCAFDVLNTISVISALLLWIINTGWGDTNDGGVTTSYTDYLIYFSILNEGRISNQVEANLHSERFRLKILTGKHHIMWVLAVLLCWTEFQMEPLATNAVLDLVFTSL